MRNRLKLIIALFVAAGIAAFAIPKVSYKDRTEEWMEQVIPTELPRYRFSTNVKMDKATYDILVPFGIVGRLYMGPDDRSYEFITIAGNTRKSFHDPQVCFSAQGWQRDDVRVEDVDIPALGGKVPATVMSLTRSGASGFSMYFYKGPFGYRGTPLMMPVDLTGAKLLMKEDVDGQFFRFILTPAGKSRADDIKALCEFANTVFTEVAKGEGGAYFIARR
jgi:hypothetical protein